MTENIIFRPATFDDLDTFFELYRYEHIESYGNFGMTKKEVFAEWEYHSFDISNHSYFAFTETGENIAYSELRYWREIPVRPILYAYVHPDYRGQGIGTKLTQWGIDNAKHFIPLVPDDARVVLGTFSNMEDGQELLENMSFTNTRQSYIMTIDIHDNMPEPQFDEQFDLITMAEHPVLEDFVRVYQETFRDHRGSVNESLESAVERWRDFLEGDNYQPENIVLVKDGVKDAAVLFLADKSDQDPDQMEISTIGTMPDYRRRGLATNLLYLTFQRARERSKPRVGLSVDGSSLTKAHELYEKVGMKTTMIYYAYELELRAGVELSNQG